MLRSLLLSLLVGFAVQRATCLPPANASYQAPIHGLDHPDRLPNVYLVAFMQNYTLDQHWHTIGRNLSYLPKFIHYDALFGYAAEMNYTIRDIVRSDPHVTFLETDRVSLRHNPPVSRSLESDSSTDPQVQKRQSTLDYNIVIQPNATWNLQMIGAGGKLPIPIYDGTGEYEALYQAGRGVNIYVLDTGIRISHVLFQGRAKNFGGLKSTDKTPYLTDEVMDDLNGHGTHVAGIAGAQQYGVADGANLINVKVANKDGYFEYRLLLKAVNDVYKDHNNNRKNLKGWDFRGSVINMSFGGYGNAFWLGQALGWARWYGINVVGAAGNDNQDTSTDWPCYWDGVLCVAAVDSDYFKAEYSNHGKEIDYLAPGTDIWSLGISSDNATQKESGCSMASPHVAGMAAIFVSWKGLATGGADSYVWWNALSDLSKGWPSSIFGGNTKNILATTGIRNPKKYPKEPFRWASDDPVANAANEGVVPISGVTNTPAFALQTTDVVTLTTSGVNFTQTPTSGLQTMSSLGVDNTFDNMTVPAANNTSGVPESAVPTSILSALGVTALGGPSSPSSSTMTSTSASSTSASTTTTGGPSPCVGNQIQGSCVQAHLPSSTPNSGTQSAVCDKVDSSTGYLMFNATQAANGVSTYCSNLISNKVVLSSSNTAPSPGYVNKAAENGKGYIAITVLFDVGSCNPGTSEADQVLDFGSWTEDKCYEYLYTAIEQECSKDPSWPDYNADYSVEGGVWASDCAMWSLSGLAGSAP